ncbi:hypothetical protein [Nonomuraea sp. NPDC049684]|uniref:hypothetical protein n=1 Tax=Nonomuraea sp. NPDC049684 TaxID=3364356 RepID=UPI0037B3F975
MTGPEDLTGRARIRQAAPLHFGEHGFGVDVFSPEGAHPLALTLLDLYSHPLLTPEAAAGLRDALAKPPGHG